MRPANTQNDPWCWWVIFITRQSFLSRWFIVYMQGAYIISYRIVSYRIVSYHTIPYHTISYHISYHIIYHIIYNIISYHISHPISYHIIYVKCIFMNVCRNPFIADPNMGFRQLKLYPADDAKLCTEFLCSANEKRCYIRNAFSRWLRDSYHILSKMRLSICFNDLRWTSLLCRFGYLGHD